MDIESLLKKGREIWGDDTLLLDEILIRHGVTTGDLHRLARNGSEGKDFDQNEVKKEMGNIIFSMIRWCDDMGYSPEECIELAIAAQKQYKSSQNG